MAWNKRFTKKVAPNNQVGVPVQVRFQNKRGSLEQGYQFVTICNAALANPEPGAG
ncbi:hypothetical protein TPL01_28370 [Sulfuriferula plumbiphila]|uniref:Uncharacterized protein n=1 Tax=Sulfuriferula plumbiphila TaxID=171865 RepID=A0A512LB39_9PROT|nr:hypothetical protein SFPGR_17370 [Sulfuriferula plumbiphila]GEP31699.1 hypothetical protein TPL01_28370 [Sulfuriferula plumbiphila]